jgi:high affinity Mn2+ porin
VEIADQPGSIMFDGFVTRGRMGRFDDAIVLAEETGSTPDTGLVRRYATRIGVNLNFEQQVVPNVGAFGRVGWADGNVETYEFADVDRTASLGTQLAGKLWGRPDDSFGLGGVVNGISAPHIAMPAASASWSATGNFPIPATNRSWKPITAFRSARYEPPQTTSSSSIPPITATPDRSQ